MQGTLHRTCHVNHRLHTQSGLDIVHRRTHDDHARMHVAQVEVEAAVAEAPLVLRHERARYGAHGVAQRHGRPRALSAESSAASSVLQASDEVRCRAPQERE